MGPVFILGVICRWTFPGNEFEDFDTIELTQVMNLVSSRSVVRKPVQSFIGRDEPEGKKPFAGRT